LRLPSACAIIRARAQTEPLPASGYDAVADDYLEHILDELPQKPLDRELRDSPTRFGAPSAASGTALDPRGISPASESMCPASIFQKERSSERVG
jgi:hypothetical protein